MDATLSSEIGLNPGDDGGNHNDHYWSYHPGAVNFAMADGSVQSMGYDIDFQVFRALSTRNGQETFDTPF